MSTKSTTRQRIEIIDALRGFSLAGIVIVHFVENFIGSAVPQNILEDMHVGPLEWLWRSITFLKSYPLRKNMQVEL